MFRGQGLGANEQGITECLQIKRRAEGSGLGTEEKAPNEWNDWWSKSYNQIAKKIVKKHDGDSTTSSSDDSSSSDESHEPRKTSIKKASVQQGKLRRIMRQERSDNPKRQKS